MSVKPCSAIEMCRKLTVKVDKLKRELAQLKEELTQLKSRHPADPAPA
jgi:hypothetical protein